MINIWVEKRKIYQMDEIYQIHKEHLEKFVVSVDQNKGKFREEFLDGDSNILPEEIIFLRKHFLSKTRTKFKIQEAGLINYLKNVDITVGKGHGKCISYETKDKLFHEISEEEIIEFFDRFILISNQPDEEELEELIKDQIQLHYGLTQKEVDLVYIEVYSKIEKWWKEDSYYLTENDNWFSESMKNHSIQYFKQYLKEINLNYKDTKILKLSIDQNTVINIVCPDSTKILFCAKIYQTLNEIDVQYLMVDNDLAYDMNDKLVNAFEEEFDTLVIRDIKSTFPERQLVKFIKITESNPKKRLILIGERFINHPSIKPILEIDVGFGNLETQRQEEILLNTKIVLNDKIINLKKLISSNLFHLIDNETLVNIIKQNSLTIGMKQTSNVPFYVPRKLQKKCFVDQNFLKSTTDKVALSGDFNQNFFPKLVFDFNNYNKKINISNYDIFLLKNPETDYALLSKTQPIHWFKCDNGKLIWMRSNRNQNSVRTYLIEDSYLDVNEEDLKECEDKIIVVAAEAGMGKTTLLSNIINNPIAQIFKYRINLLDHSKEFASYNKIDPLDFLRKSCNMDELEFKLFQAYFNNEGSIVLYFDGFDEISPDYKEIVLMLFCDLMKSKVEKIYITTRLSVKEELEDTLNTIAYSLRPFSEDDQKQFLKSFWKKDDNFVSDILHRFSFEINDELRNFIGIPLQLKMLAEVYDETLFDKEMNLYKIYDRFFEKKYYEVQCVEKGKVDLNNLSIKKAIELDYHDVKTKLGKLAMVSLYGKQLALHFKEFRDIQNTLKDEIKEGKERTGIVSCVIDGEPKFVHRTYAEFFAATWLVNMFLDSKSIKKFLLAIDYFGSENVVMRRFFDLAMCEDDEVCRAVLRNDENIIRGLSHSQVISSRDKGGRTLLHLAVAQDNETIVSKLIELGADVSIADDIFSFTPISYADKFKNMPLMDYLLYHGAEAKEMFDTIDLYSKFSFHRDRILEVCEQKKCYRIIKYLSKEMSHWWNKESDMPNQTLLHVAIRNGDFEKFPRLMGVKDNNSFLIPSNGFTLLHAAVFFDSLQFVEYIANRRGQFLNIKDYSSRTPLLIAAEKGNLEVVKILVQAGARVNMKTFIWTPLDVAKENGFEDIVQFISSNGGIYGNLPNNTMETIAKIEDIIKSPKFRSAIKVDLYAALCILNQIANIGMKNNQLELESEGFVVNLGNHLIRNAIITGNIEFVKHVLNNNENLMNIMDQDGNTPLHLASMHGRSDIVEFLIERGIGDKVLNDDGKSSLYLAIQNGHLDVVKWLVAKHRLEARDVNGDTPLHLAVSMGMLDIVHWLVEQSANPLAKNLKHRNCMHVAAEKHHLDILMYLLSMNIQCLQAQDDYGNTFMHYGAANDIPNIIIFLLSKGADPSIRNSNGQTCLHIAVKHGHMDIISTLLKQNKELAKIADNYNTTPLHLACSEGTLDAVKCLLENGADPLYKNTLGWTPLLCAVGLGHSEVAAHLVNAYPQCINVEDNRGNTPLHMAVLEERLNIVGHLIESGADLMIRNKIEQTAAHIATQYGHFDILKLLISKCKELVNVQDGAGDTPLHIAVFRTRLNIVEFLLLNGADVCKKNKKGQTPLNLAVKMQNGDIFKKFLAKNQVNVADEDYEHVQQFIARYLT